MRGRWRKRRQKEEVDRKASNRSNNGSSNKSYLPFLRDSEEDSAPEQKRVAQ
jgi:hypothetical protein